MRVLTQSSKHERSGHSRSLSFPSVCVWQRNELTTSHKGDTPTRLGCLRSRQREVLANEWFRNELSSLAEVSLYLHGVLYQKAGFVISSALRTLPLAKNSPHEHKGTRGMWLSCLLQKGAIVAQHFSFYAHIHHLAVRDVINTRQLKRARFE